MDEPLRLLPKSIEMPDDTRPCVRPLTEKENLELCAKHNINPKHFRSLDWERLAEAIPTKCLSKLILVRDVSGLEGLDLAVKTAESIAADPNSKPKIKLLAAKAILQSLKARAEYAEHLMQQSEKAEEKVKKDKPRLLPPRTMAVQVNVTGNNPTVATSATKSDSSIVPNGNR